MAFEAPIAIERLSEETEAKRESLAKLAVVEGLPEAQAISYINRYARLNGFLGMNNRMILAAISLLIDFNGRPTHEDMLNLAKRSIVAISSKKRKVGSSDALARTYGRYVHALEVETRERDKV